MQEFLVVASVLQWGQVSLMISVVDTSTSNVVYWPVAGNFCNLKRSITKVFDFVFYAKLLVIFQNNGVFVEKLC